MVTEAMEQEQHHDHDDEEDTTEDSFGATVILGKGEYLCIYLDWPSFFSFWYLCSSVEETLSWEASGSSTAQELP